MLVFATCVGSAQTYRRRAVAGLRRAAEPDSLIVETSTDHSIHEAYNEVLEHVAGVDGVEALVLLHEDVELLNDDFGERVRAALAQPGVAVAGAIGAAGVDRLAWWEGRIAGRVVETRGTIDPGFAEVDVDALDGLLLVLSPWAIANLRCDTSTYTGFHAYDVDLCLQARSAGRRCVVTELDLFHAAPVKERMDASFHAADAALRAKWGFATAVPALSLT